ncbi:hypothetical protein [Halopiger goleimassiliensis]|nr:hypothetical protein [Halopiger goleimassiliensis]
MVNWPESVPTLETTTPAPGPLEGGLEWPTEDEIATVIGVYATGD